MKLTNVILAVMLTVVLLISSVMGVTAASVPSADHSMQEVLALYQATAGIQTVTVAQTAAWDYDHDGNLSMRDALLLYGDVSGSKPMMQEALAFETTTINSWVGSSLDAPSVITTAEQWQAFRVAYFGDYQPFAYFGDIAVPENAVIPVSAPQQDAYVAAVSADDTAVYVALVDIAVDGTVTIESDRYILIEVDPTAVADKEIVVTHYTDTATMCPAQNATVYAAPMAAECDCGYDHAKPVVFDSLSAQEVYIAAHASEAVDASAYVPYDEAFYEEYVLVELYAVFGIPSLNLKAEYMLATADTVFINVTHTVHTESAPSVLEYAHVLVPVSREVYQGQDIVAQMCAYKYY